MLEIGVGRSAHPKDRPLSPAESRSHFGGWAIVSSPLILSHDLTNETIADEIWPLIANPEIIRVNQAWTGIAGGIFKESNETVALEFYEGDLKKTFYNSQFTYYYKPISKSNTF